MSSYTYDPETQLVVGRALWNQIDSGLIVRRAQMEEITAERDALSRDIATAYECRNKAYAERDALQAKLAAAEASLDAKHADLVRVADKMRAAEAERDCARVERDGAVTRAQMVLDHCNTGWAEVARLRARATQAEDALTLLHNLRDREKAHAPSPGEIDRETPEAREFEGFPNRKPGAPTPLSPPTGPSAEPTEEAIRKALDSAGTVGDLGVRRVQARAILALFASHRSPAAAVVLPRKVIPEQFKSDQGWNDALTEVAKALRAAGVPLAEEKERAT